MVIGSPEHQDEVNQRWLRRQARQQGRGRQLSIPGTNDISQIYNGSLGQGTQTEPLDEIMNRIGRKYPVRRRRQLISFDDANTVAGTLYRQGLLSLNRTPSFDRQQLEVALNVLRYIIADPEGPYPLSKGLFIYGPPGTGKSYLMEAMRQLVSLVPIPEMSFSEVSTKEIIRQVDIAKNLKPLDGLVGGGLLLDDLGEEAKKVTVYKENKDPMDLLLTERYKRFVRNGQLTHATSNLDPDDLKTKYGTRLYERFAEMIEPVLFPGLSKRINGHKRVVLSDTYSISADAITNHLQYESWSDLERFANTLPASSCYDGPAGLQTYFNTWILKNRLTTLNDGTDQSTPA